MNVGYSKAFLKQAKKLPAPLRQQLYDRIELFTKNPLHRSLRNHALKGKWKEYRSINITGDVRALYLVRSDEMIFDAVGSHSQLYR